MALVLPVVLSDEQEDSQGVFDMPMTDRR